MGDKIELLAVQKLFEDNKKIFFYKKFLSF